MRILLNGLTLLTNTLVKLLRWFGHGGTALPGLWVEKYVPQLIASYAQYYQKIIFITGTNGKTTTQLTLQSILQQGNAKVTNNHSGSNMFRGIAATILSAGVPTKRSVLLCEVEEATMPIVTKYIKPHLIVITNLFRDQLDAYGELHKTATYLVDACQNSPSAVVIANADDPMVGGVLRQITHKKITFSIGQLRSLFTYEGQSNDVINSVGAVTYTIRTAEVQSDLSTKITIVDAKNKEDAIEFQPPGIYNVYNMLAAFSTASEMGIDKAAIILGIQETKPPFGRGEKVLISRGGKDTHLQLFLVKNPAGFSQVWNLLASLQDQIDLVLGLNDNIADGRDVSWIWDINMSKFHNKDFIRNIYFTGQRAYDMALRCKYAGVESINSVVIPNIEQCLADLIQKNNNNRRCYLLMTYTATNMMRKALEQYVNISPFLS